jgi:RimJ/RimL family protein N-acetyltransferase
MTADEAMTIASERLDLITLSPAFFTASLAGDRAAAERILGVSIPPEWYGKQATMEMRLADLRSNPSLQPWLLRAMVLREDRLMVGHIGFHDGPNAEHLRAIAPGAVEFGYTVFPPFRRRGYAREASRALMRWAHQEQHVTRFVVSIRPDNLPSRRLAEQFGFQKIGSHVDEIDGLEEIYELQHVAGQCACSHLPSPTVFRSGAPGPPERAGG